MPSNSPIPISDTACLYVVTTPIGNLRDITLRALDVLSQVDLVAAEDTRHTRQLLDAHGLHCRLISYHEHNENRRTPELMERLIQGERIALVSNAGTPMVSDPGFRLVSAAIAHNIPVVPVPGVSAAITALSVSGLASDAFHFAGFPARRTAKRKQQLALLAGEPATLIFYQSPHRLVSFLEEIVTALGERQAVLCRELTKLHEEVIRGTVSHILAQLRDRPSIKGECTLLIAGADPSASEPASEDWQSVLQAALARKEKPLSHVVKEVARQFNLSRKQVYDMALHYSATE